MEILQYKTYITTTEQSPEASATSNDPYVKVSAQQITKVEVAVDTDTTLTQENKAADAKAVGDALKNKLDKITTNVEAVITQKPDGSTDCLSFATGTVPYYLVRRDANSQIQVVTPVERVHGANKGYVDDKVNTEVIPFIAQIFPAENLSEGIIDGNTKGAIVEASGCAAVLIYDSLTYDVVLVINSNFLNGTFQYIYHNKMYYCQVGKDTVIEELSGQGGSDIDLSKYYEKQNQVLIESGLVQVGNDSDENERPANHTRIESTGLQTINWMYNSLARLQSQTYMREGKFENIPSLRLGYTRLIPTDNTVDAYLTLPKKDGTLATLDDVGGGAVYHEDTNFPMAVTEKTFYDIVGQPEQTHIINGSAVVNIFANTGFNVFYQLPGSTHLAIYSYGVAADENGLHPASVYSVLISDGGNVWVLGETAVSGRFIATTYDGTKETVYEPSKIVDNINGTEINIPQNRNGTFALTEDVENKLDKVTTGELGAIRVYGVLPNGGQTMVTASNTVGGQLVQRLDDGNIPTVTPVRNSDVTPKKYVDDLVGDIETALDGIIAIQNALIGGNE